MVLSIGDKALPNQPGIDFAPNYNAKVQVGAM